MVISLVKVYVCKLLFLTYIIAYNAKLQAIADKYKGTANGTFAVMYSPAPIDISTFPVDALR
jgi:phospholipase B1